MRTVQTVLGPVDAARLGRTLLHEHVFLSFPGSSLDPAAKFDRTEFILEASRRLAALKAHGVSTIVDPCPVEFGRDVRLLAEVSQRSGLNIICTTGFYFERLGIPTYWRMRSVAEIAEFLIGEIEQGIEGTQIRAGAIKCATGAPAITPLEENFLAAACIAQRQTDVPIITHTQDGLCGPEQQQLFAKGGVALHRCLIGHCCQNSDPNYHKQIARADSYVGFDRIGLPRFQSDEVRADTLAELLRSGFGHRIVLSQDRYCALIGGVPNDKGQPPIARLGGDPEWPPSYTYLFTDFLPMLRSRGISEAQINVMLDDNPHNFLMASAAG